MLQLQPYLSLYAHRTAYIPIYNSSSACQHGSLPKNTSSTFFSLLLFLGAQNQGFQCTALPYPQHFLLPFNSVGEDDKRKMSLVSIGALRKDPSKLPINSSHKLSQTQQQTQYYYSLTKTCFFKIRPFGKIQSMFS